MAVLVKFKESVQDLHKTGDVNIPSWQDTQFRRPHTYWYIYRNLRTARQKGLKRPHSFPRSTAANGINSHC